VGFRSNSGAHWVILPSPQTQGPAPNAAVRSWKAKESSKLQTAITMLRMEDPSHPLLSEPGFQVAEPRATKGSEVSAPRARGKGDLFAHTGTGFGAITIGHPGIYSSPEKIVHATGRPLGNNNHQGVVRESRSKAGLRTGYSKIMWVNTSATTRTEAVNFANGKVGKAGYSFNWSANKVIEAKSYNCSQLVWAAFKKQGAC